MCSVHTHSWFDFIASAHTSIQQHSQHSLCACLHCCYFCYYYYHIFYSLSFFHSIYPFSIQLVLVLDRYFSYLMHLCCCFCCEDVHVCICILIFVGRILFHKIIEEFSIFLFFPSFSSISCSIFPHLKGIVMQFIEIHMNLNKKKFHSIFQTKYRQHYGFKKSLQFIVKQHLAFWTDDITYTNPIFFSSYV